MTTSFTDNSNTMMKYSNDDISLGKRSMDDNFMTVLPRIIDPTLGLTHVRKEGNPQSNHTIAKPMVKTTRVPEKHQPVETTEGVKDDTPQQQRKSSNVKYYIILFISILIAVVIIYFIYKYFQRTTEPDTSNAEDTTESTTDGNHKSSVLENLSKYINVSNENDDTNDDTNADTDDDTDDDPKPYSSVDHHENVRVEIIEEKTDAPQPSPPEHNVELENVDVESITEVPVLEHTMDALLEEHSVCSSFDADDRKVDMDVLDTESADDAVDNEDEVMDVFKRYTVASTS